MRMLKRDMGVLLQGEVTLFFITSICPEQAPFPLVLFVRLPWSRAQPCDYIARRPDLEK